MTPSITLALAWFNQNYCNHCFNGLMRTLECICNIIAPVHASMPVFFHFLGSLERYWKTFYELNPNINKKVINVWFYILHTVNILFELVWFFFIYVYTIDMYIRSPTYIKTPVQYHTLWIVASLHRVRIEVWN